MSRSMSDVSDSSENASVQSRTSLDHCHREMNEVPALRRGREDYNTQANASYTPSTATREGKVGSHRKPSMIPKLELGSMAVVGRSESSRLPVEEEERQQHKNRQDYEERRDTSSMPLSQFGIGRGQQDYQDKPESYKATIEILSPAFDLDIGRKDISKLKMECGRHLCVKNENRIKLFKLVEIDDESELFSSDSRLAVEIKGSTLTLRDIEEILRENQRLSKSSVEQKYNETESLRQEVAMLRERLTNSEGLRKRGQKALRELKEEFETLHFDLLSAQTPR